MTHSREELIKSLKRCSKLAAELGKHKDTGLTPKDVLNLLQEKE